MADIYIQSSYTLYTERAKHIQDMSQQYSLEQLGKCPASPQLPHIVLSSLCFGVILIPRAFEMPMVDILDIECIAVGIS